MELTKKTTILFSADLHDRLSQLAKQEHVSLGQLVRAACERQYGFVSTNARVSAAETLCKLQLPVSDPRTMKKQSTPEPDELLP